jgi:hypothetical protein
VYVVNEGRDILEVISDEDDVRVVKDWGRVWFVVRMSEGGLCEVVSRFDGEHLLILRLER